MRSSANLTETDRYLLALLKQNARASYSELAANLGISRTTIKDRIDRLVDRGVIKRFTIETAETDSKTIQSVRAFFHLHLHRPVCNIIHDRVKGWPELTGCWSIAGSTDMTLQLCCTSDENLEDLRDQLARHPEVKTLWTELVLRQWFSRPDLQAEFIPGPAQDALDLRLAELGTAHPALNSELR